MRRTIRSTLLSLTLHLYNAGAFLLLNVVLWRNHMWNERSWTPRRAAETKNKTGRSARPVLESLSS